MRDTFRPDGLRNFVIKIHNGRQFIIQRIKLNTEKDKKKSLERMLFSMLIEKTIAHYSVGDDKATVTTSLLETLPVFEDAFEYRDLGQNYDYALWLVSLGVLCDIPLEEFKRITVVLQRDKLNDTIFTTIIQSKQPDWPTSTKAPWYATLYAIILNASTAADIKNYLDKKWYQAHKEAYWHGLHKNIPVNNYFGYWSWESAALAKIKGIDDSSLTQQNYYPYDAVHW